MTQTSIDKAVGDRYSAAAKVREAALCCPVDYNREYLKVIPSEVIERDYGCGDPSAFLKEGETVLDLGSGGGKICFIAAQVVGKSGKVIGVDINDDMLNLAKKMQPQVVEKIGYDNIHFYKARIQDLQLDRDALDKHLRDQPIGSERAFLDLENLTQRWRQERPLIQQNSIDTVVSNCVLNLVDQAEKPKLFREIFRVLKKGGRAVISDIVADEPVPQHLQDDPDLWSGCISGALEEKQFVEAFEQAGFYGIEILKRDQEPWQTVEGIEFRSMTIQAYKGKEGPCLEHNDAVIYKGPFAEIFDDDGHRFVRGERVAVCRKTAKILQKSPYAEHFVFVGSRVEVEDAEAKPFSCDVDMKLRSPKETKGLSYRETKVGPEGCC